MLPSEGENQADGLGHLGNRTRDEVVSDVGNPALAWLREAAAGEQRDPRAGPGAQLSAWERPKDKSGVPNSGKGTGSSNEAHEGTGRHPAQCCLFLPVAILFSVLCPSLSF